MGFSVMSKVVGSDDVYPLLGRPHDSLGDSYEVPCVLSLALMNSVITSLSLNILEQHLMHLLPIFPT